MNQGKYIFAQLTDFLPRRTLDRIVAEHSGNKYVQMACGTAYNSVLMALDEYLIRKQPKKGKAKSIEEYRTRLSKQNKTLLRYLNDAYDELHLAGYYHGTPSAKTVQSGFQTAMKIINYQNLRNDDF